MTPKTSKRKNSTVRTPKFSLNLETDKENNAPHIAMDENSLVALETKGQSSEVMTPGKELFRLIHSHKRKSEAWSAKSLPINKTPQSIKTKAGVKSAANTPCKKSTSKTPLKLTSIKKTLPKQTPSKSGKSKSISKDEGITPRMTRRMSKLLCADIVENSNIADEEGMESDDEDEPVIESCSSRKRRVASKAKTPMVERCQKRIRASKELSKVLQISDSSSESSDMEDDEIEAPSYSKYFSEIKGLSKKFTSNNNLSQLPVLEPQEYLNELKNICDKTKDLVIEQNERLQQFFPDWIFELNYGFNILCYGYGSKKDLLEQFVENYFDGYPVLKVNGFFPNLNIRSILSPLLELIEHTGPIGSLNDQVNLILNYFNSPDREIKNLVLLIHNIDSVSLRNDKSSTILSLLAECPAVYMIASVDHINAPCLWDHHKSKRFNWIWHDATSFAPWISESTFENSVLVKSAGIGPRNVISVVNSLNAHARGIFGILAKDQIANQSLGQGMSWNLLFQSCCEHFLVTNEITFSSLMTEFIDHKIVVKQSDGSLEIPLDLNSLISVVEELNL